MKSRKNTLTAYSVRGTLKKMQRMICIGIRKNTPKKRRVCWPWARHTAPKQKIMRTGAWYKMWRRFPSSRMPKALRTISAQTKIMTHKSANKVGAKKSCPKMIRMSTHARKMPQISAHEVCVEASCLEPGAAFAHTRSMQFRSVEISVLRHPVYSLGMASAHANTAKRSLHMVGVENIPPSNQQ